MKKPVIAVDIDDTLASHAEAFVEWSNQKYDTRLQVDDYTDHWSEMWQIDREETERRALEFHDEKIHGDLPIKDDSYDVLKRLSNRFSFVIVTARRQIIVEDTKKWIKQYYEDVFDNIEFVPIWDQDRTLTKTAICQKLTASYLIDDVPKHCNSAAEAGMKALLFGDYYWTRTAETHENVTRVKNWLEVEKYFDNV